MKLSYIPMAAITFSSCSPFTALAQTAIEPTIRGNYYVCPNGNAVRKDFGSFFDHSQARLTLFRRNSAKEIKDVYAEIIIGKTPDNYPRDEISKLKTKILQGINVPTSYRLKRINRDYHVKHGQSKIQPEGMNARTMDYYTFEFGNSQGKEMSLSMSRWETATIKDNNGKLFRANDFQSFHRMGDLRSLRCNDDVLTVRDVRSLVLGEVSNEYGEKVKLPLMFVIREVNLRTKRPSSQNQYSF